MGMALHGTPQTKQKKKNNINKDSTTNLPNRHVGVDARKRRPAPQTNTPDASTQANKTPDTSMQY